MARGQVPSGGAGNGPRVGTHRPRLPASGGRGAPRRRRPSWRAVVLAACAGAVLAAWGGADRLLAAVGGLVRPEAVVEAPSLRVPAVFFRPGAAVLAPVAGRIASVAAPGETSGGAPVARILPSAPAGVRRGPGKAPAAAGPTSGWRRVLAAWWCIRPSCGAAAPAPAPAPQVTARAPSAGFFTPGWDALAVLPASAYADLLPAALAADAWPAPRAGNPVAAGTPLGVVGMRWTGVWVAVLPELEADAALASIPAGAPVSIRPPGMAPVPATAVAAGPPSGGLRAVAFSSDQLGGGSAPPARAIVLLGMPAVRGEAVPAAALRWRSADGAYLPAARRPWTPGSAERALVAVWRGGRARWRPVRVLGVDGAVAVVAGLAPGTAGVLARPGWVAPWIVGPASAARA